MVLADEVILVVPYAPVCYTCRATSHISQIARAISRQTQLHELHRARSVQRHESQLAPDGIVMDLVMFTIGSTTCWTVRFAERLVGLCKKPLILRSAVTMSGFLLLGKVEAMAKPYRLFVEKASIGRDFHNRARASTDM